MTREGNEEEDKRRIASEAFGDRDDTISKGKTNPLQGRPRALSEGSYFDQNRRDLGGSYRGSFDSAETDSTIDEDDFLDDSNLSPNVQALLEWINQLKEAHRDKDSENISFVQNNIKNLLATAANDERAQLTKLLQEKCNNLPEDRLESILRAQPSTEMHHGPDSVTASENPATHAPSPLQMASPKLDEAFRKALEEKFQGNLAVVEPILKLLAARTPQASKAAAKEVRDNAGEKVSEVYHEVFKLCEKRGGSNIAHSQLEGSALKIEIDGVRITCQPDPSGKHKFQLPNNELTKPIMIRCNQTYTILVLGPPNGQAVEVIPPVGKTLESIKAQCMFDVEHYKAEAG